ncbi:NADH oxidase [Tepiditoga spiralis]|uniref:NADH oxidase n=1 Tax=Tepiditoga spiralis TaxID=2108365 RepID=A0A7G1G4C4_9BACT|nr:FAD-dependent oxidoreductase [Tepiditoga spiralis]BBE30066.1 NADH oxidase [Tepiditoga spiralis]
MSNLKYDVVVIGGVAAGTSAAATIKRIKSDMSVCIFQKEPYISYGGCGLPYSVSGEVKSPESVIGFTPEIFKEKKGADVFINHEVYKVNFDNKKVYVKNENDEFEVEYKNLVISTGASPIMPKFTYTGNGVFKLRNPTDARTMLDFINENNPKKGIVIGGGYIGIESAEALKKHGIDVTVIEGTDKLLRGMEDELLNAFKDMTTKSLKVEFNTMVEDITFDNGIKVITKNKNYDADIVVVAIGVRPNTGFLKGTDLEMLKNGAIVVNEKSQTNIKDVYSAGDCASVKNYITKKDVYIPLGTTANKQGRVAGKNICDVKESFEGVVGSLITKYEDVEFAKTGFSLSEALESGFDAIKVYVKSGSKAHYYSGSKKIHMTMTVEKSTGRILGAQYVGGEVFARLNAITPLLYKNGTVDDLRNMDLAYAPPFSPVWDINLVAANLAKKKI